MQPSFVLQLDSVYVTNLKDFGIPEWAQLTFKNIWY
jgi:hypothetical protein